MSTNKSGVVLRRRGSAYDAYEDDNCVASVTRDYGAISGRPIGWNVELKDADRKWWRATLDEVRRSIAERHATNADTTS